LIHRNWIEDNPDSDSVKGLKQERSLKFYGSNLTFCQNLLKSVNKNVPLLPKNNLHFSGFRGNQL